MIDGLFVLALIGAAAWLFDENYKLRKRIAELENGKEVSDGK
jgi:hypothetical protein